MPPICLVCRLILIICSLYCAHRLDTERLVEIDIFGRSERFDWPTNKASNRPTKNIRLVQFFGQNPTDLLFGRRLWMSVGSFLVGRSLKRYNRYCIVLLSAQF